MPSKTDKGEGVSNDTSTAKIATETGIAVREGGGDLSEVREALGGLSRETVEKLSLELNETLHQITMGLEDKIKVRKIFDRGDPFMVIDATTIKDYVDKRTGDVSDKHVFVLEFDAGDVQVIMQSDAGPRERLANLFSLARSLGTQAVAGKYKIVEKEVGQPQPAFIFEKQPGFQARVL